MIRFIKIMEHQDPAVLKELAAIKEKEWKDISEKRLLALEEALAEKDKMLSQQSAMLQKLKDDFKYNLKLLEERDQELEHYDLNFTDLKAQLHVRCAELSEAQIRLDDVKKAQAREQQARDELHARYQQRLKEKQAEIEAFRNVKNGEMQHERSDFEALRRKLQHQLTEVQAELEKQRQELTAEFENALQKREHEHRTYIDEMSGKVMEHDLKAQLLAKELELVRADHQSRSEQAEEAFLGQRELEKQLKQARWQIADITAMKDARIKDLTEKLQQHEKATAMLQEDFHRKYAEMDRSMRDAEASAQRLKVTCTEKEEKLVQEMRQLQSQLEDSHIQMRQLQWSNSDLKKDHEMAVEKLQEEIYQLQSRWDNYLKDMSHDTVTRDVELQKAREEISQLRSDLMQRKEDLDRYKKELQQATEREKSLERAKVQVELDWQKRCEELERRQYNKSEDLIASLTQARDEALADCKEKNRELEQTQMLMRAVSRDRDIAMATLKKHDIPLDKNIKFQSEKYDQEVENLQDQNKGLRAALASMKEIMESMGHSVPTAVAIGTSQDNDYVASLETEVKKLKQEKRDLSEKVAIAERFGRLAKQPAVDSQTVLAEVKDSNVKSHIMSLNDMLGVLRGEKVELAATVKKQQARIQHLDEALEEANKQPRELQVTLEQLRYEIGAHQRRHSAESAAQRQRIMLLESQLTETQKEADMFHQASVENNAELTALRNQFSSLKLDLAERHPAINFGAQELVIQQLQEELTTLRQRLAGSGHDAHSGAKGNSGAPDSVADLRSRLQLAAKYISQLVKEKQQLLELSNKLRAELKQAGVEPSLRPVKGPRSSAAPFSLRPSPAEDKGRLSQLERLQYELTRQELQYAQRFTPATKQDSETPEKSHYSRPLTPAGDGVLSQSRENMASSLRASAEIAGSEFMSSDAGQSVVDVLRLLDGPQSPDIRLPSPRRADTSHYDQPGNRERDSLSLARDSGGIGVYGQKMKPDSRSQQQQSAVSRPSSSTTGAGIRGTGDKKGSNRQQRPKIRNYNIRDDRSVR